MRYSIITLLLTIFLSHLSFFSAFAQETPVLTFNHLALSVTDLNRSAEFYKNVMHLQEITNKTKIEGIRWFSMGAGNELHLISIIKEPVTINKAVHVALNTSGFDNFVKQLEARGIPYSDWPGKANTVNIRTDGVKQIFFQDPDGYWLEVNSAEME
jgi:lactoylglutathione lyase